MARTTTPARPNPRERALATASALFYAQGIRAVGMEQIVAESGIAKTTIYRHFPTKDALIAAFLEYEDAEFWSQWDAALDGAACTADQLDALCGWVGERVSRDGYRGCPQINAAAEFADPGHPARQVARAHKAEMHRRLAVVCSGFAEPDEIAMQIALLFDGAFMSDGRLRGRHAGRLLGAAVARLTELPDPGLADQKS